MELGNFMMRIAGKIMNGGESDVRELTDDLADRQFQQYFAFWLSQNPTFEAKGTQFVGLLRTICYRFYLQGAKNTTLTMAEVLQLPDDVKAKIGKALENL
jgi:hypothetical protein